MSHSAERLTVPRDCPHGSAVESSSRRWSHHDGACRARCCKAIPSRRRANRCQRRSDAQPSRTWATARQMSSASLSSGRRPGPTRGPNRSSMVTYSATTRVSRSARARPPRRSTLLQQRRSSAPSSQLSPLDTSHPIGINHLAGMSCRTLDEGLPTRPVVARTGLTRRPSWSRHRQARDRGSCRRATHVP